MAVPVSFPEHEPDLVSRDDARNVLASFDTGTRRRVDDEMVRVYSIEMHSYDVYRDGPVVEEITYAYKGRDATMRSRTAFVV